jgi:cyclopropane fatty-acyl-phospholipid synthase-like methyltransferase
MLQPAHITRDDVVYDLGSGDGRIVILAARRYGARGD